MTPNAKKTLAQRLKSNMGKLLLSTLLLSVIVILVTVTVIADARAKPDDSTENTSTTQSPNLQPDVSQTTQKPTANVSWSHENLKAGNGSVVIDKGIEADDSAHLIIRIISIFVVFQQFYYDIFIHFSSFADQINIPENDDYDGELLDKLEKTTKYWFDQAQSTLKDKLYREPNTNVAKNIIYFLGDGMSLTTLTAARIFQGQLQGKKGEEADLWFQKFPHVALAKVS